MSGGPAPPPEFAAFVKPLGLGPFAWEPLNGGVSSDVWKASSPDRTLVVKRAVEKLRVEADWRAPVGRTAYERAWFAEARKVDPRYAPEPIAHDPALGLLAMAYLPLETHPEWRAELNAGRVDPDAGARVGEALARIHAATARRTDLHAAFDTTELFFALRLEPFLLAAARKHPGVADVLQRLAVLTASRRIALCHGDVSPKNILLGRDGPTFLDAETAWYGDPAFDLAFCLNHLWLAALVDPDHAPAILKSFGDMAAAYLKAVAWEDAAGLETRAAALLPALMLARVDGKSPLPDLRTAAQKDRVREVATALLRRPAPTLDAVAARL